MLARHLALAEIHGGGRPERVAGESFLERSGRFELAHDDAQETVAGLSPVGQRACVSSPCGKGGPCRTGLRARWLR